MNTYHNKDAKEYNRKKVNLRFLDIFFVILYLLAFQIFLSLSLKKTVFTLTPNFYYAFSLYLIVFCISYYIINLPLHFYSAFIIEHRFKLSNQSFWNWFKDDVKSGVLSFFIFLIFMQVLYVLLKQFTVTWWVWIAIFWFLATTILARITPILIIPLFFKCSPVEDRLKKKVIELAKKCKIKILDVYKIDFSKKTNKTNALVTGLGKTRRVLLADNLISDFTEGEVASVLLHEFGHHARKHIWKHLAFGAALTTLSFFLLYLASSRMVILLNGEAVYDIKIFPVFMLFLFLVGFLMQPIQNAFSRALETEADIFALRVIEDKSAFISLMQKLASKNLADPNPSKLVKFLFYTHPPISDRIQLAKKLQNPSQTS